MFKSQMKRERTRTIRKSCEVLNVRRGFTLVELLAIVTLFLLLSVLVVPTMVRARHKSKAATCQSNLKQIGLAIQAYAEANNQVLPGPAFALVAAEYDLGSTNQIASFLAERLGCPPPSNKRQTVPEFRCPAHTVGNSSGPSPVADYVLNEQSQFPIPPFGSATTPGSNPLKLSAIAAITRPATCFAIADADKANVNPTLPGWKALPYQPVHGQVRNQLFFDWHVSSTPW